MILSLPLMILALFYGGGLVTARPRTFGLFLLPAGLLAFGADASGLGGLAGLSAIWLLCLIILCLAVIGKLETSSGGLTRTELCYVGFLTWCAFEAMRAQHFSYALRSFLKLLYPFLSMYVLRRTVNSIELGDRLVRLQLRVTFAVGLTIATNFPSWLGLGVVYELVWTGAAFLDHAAIIVMVTLATWRAKRDIKYLWLAAGLALLCFLAVNRTTVLALAVGGSIFCALEFRRAAVALLPAIYLGLITVLFAVPEFREKMFFTPDKAETETGVLVSSDTVTNENFNSNGRYAMWDRVMERFFWPNPLVGSGLGSTQAWFYTGEAKDAGCGDIKIEHSEYVKLLSDTGIIGLSLFILSLLSSLGDAAQAYAGSPGDGPARLFALTALCTIPTFLICMAFDNALLYVLPVAQFPFALAAIAASLTRAKRVNATYPEVMSPEIATRSRRGRFPDKAAEAILG